MKQKGYTLVEVITSIVIVGMVFVAMTSMLISSAKINKRFLVKENIVSEIENLNNLFSSDPSEFIKKVNEVYDKNFELSVTEIDLYYNGRFVSSDHRTDNYIRIMYTSDAGKYKLEIDTYVEKEEVSDFSNLTRSIIDKGWTNDQET